MNVTWAVNIKSWIKGTKNFVISMYPSWIRNCNGSVKLVIYFGINIQPVAFVDVFIIPYQILKPQLPHHQCRCYRTLQFLAPSVTRCYGGSSVKNDETLLIERVEDVRDSASGRERENKQSWWERDNGSKRERQMILAVGAKERRCEESTNKLYKTETPDQWN